jgi:hypothetical protein
MEERVMKRLCILLALPLVALLGAPSSAWAGDTICGPVPVIGGVHDNILVPPGQTCSLANATVLGNVKALENSRLFASNNTIRGNVDGDKADVVQLFGGTVGGNIQIKEGGNPFGDFDVFVGFTTLFNGNIQIEKMTGESSVFDVTLLNGTVKSEENTVFGFFGIQNNNIRQNLQVFKNTGGGPKVVLANVVGDTITCKENAPPFTGGPNTAPKKEGQCF